MEGISSVSDFPFQDNVKMAVGFRKYVNPRLELEEKKGDESENSENDPKNKIDSLKDLAELTLPGFIIKLLREKKELTLEDILKEVSPVYSNLRRTNGTKYNGELINAIKGC